ncbi:MAG TPA: alkaline phosphatase PhoX, partial [Povalibacter sp.]|nr:alkaline phosphatase PhoX [Povalibacter sp.]
MKYRTRRRAALLAIASGSIALSAAQAAPLTEVPNPNPKLAGVSAPTLLSPELRQSAVAEGAVRLENPTTGFEFYGFSSDGPHLPVPGALPGTSGPIEATKTEPDKNTYLVLRSLRGADPNYDYGTHFLFQGHENAAGGKGYLTRVNLDADGEHRVTLLASADANGASLPLIDGSTWDPWNRRLLFTAEGDGANTGGVWQATPSAPGIVNDLLGIFGRGGFEGIQTDPDGNIWIVEDIGGATIDGARVANSFIYRFMPRNRTDLTKGGKLQALQVMKLDGSGPIVFNATNALTPEAKSLHTYGNVFETRWVTVHDTDVDGSVVFNANALAKAKQATPFKRPENGQFRPGTQFREFFFDETGDTNATTTAGSDFGGFGGVLKLVQSSPSAASGRLSLLFRGDAQHTAFDNVAFWDANHVVFVEDRGDTLHAQENALDSAWLLDVRRNYANVSNQPLRILAQGRDGLATLDSQFLGTSGFQNDGDNELTGIHVSDGSAGLDGLLGAKIPRPFEDGWR